MHYSRTSEEVSGLFEDHPDSSQKGIHIITRFNAVYSSY